MVKHDRPYLPGDLAIIEFYSDLKVREKAAARAAAVARAQQVNHQVMRWLAISVGVAVSGLLYFC